MVALRIVLAPLTAILLAVTPLAGCRTHPTAAPAGPPLSAGAVLGSWKLASLGGEPVQLPAGARTPEIEFQSDGSFSSFAGVNRVNGTFDSVSIEAGALRVSPGPTTMMAGPPELMALETEFIAALAHTTAVAIVNGQLVLSDDGTELMRLVRTTGS